VDTLFVFSFAENCSFGVMSDDFRAYEYTHGGYSQDHDERGEANRPLSRRKVFVNRAVRVKERQEDCPERVIEQGCSSCEEHDTSARSIAH